VRSDAQRAYAYERDAHAGPLDKALDAADRHVWTVVDRQRDGKVVYPFGQP
jgi:hypothetical protein